MMQLCASTAKLQAGGSNLNSGHCQTNLNWPAKGTGLRRSGRQLTPLGQGGGAVLIEDVAAVELAVLVEVVVERGMDGREPLRSPLIRQALAKLHEAAQNSLTS